MARIARSSVSEAKPKNARNKSKKRSLQAFSIASAQIQEKHKIRKHRLGEIEDDGPRRKRARSDDEDEEEEDDEYGSSTRRPQKKHAKGRQHELDVSSGSDSEGNRWKLGVVDDDDDEDIDSDEAFGESDEERFAGYTFRGSTSGNGRKKQKRSLRKETGNFDVDLEEESSHAGSGSDDSLGEDAVDLATMLDDDYETDDEEEEEDENIGRRNAKRKAKELVSIGAENSSSSAEDDDENEGEEENASSDAMSDVEQEDNEDQIARLQDLVSVLQPAGDTTRRKHREADPHEARAPSTSGLISSDKFDIKDFLAATSDPQDKKKSKQVGAIPKTLKKDPKLAPSLPKRQKDKLDRVAANEKAKETLDRWVDTVKHNRRADHLSFPLINPESEKPRGSRNLVPTNQRAPMNDLENAINSILQESGLATANGEEEEDRLREFEELKTNKMPLEEVQARRAELRRARELLFREEIRSKRVKKIKSKAYRRVHRKERERLNALDRDAFAEGGESDLDDEDRDQADRRRAEERMGAKHRDSKWAKQMKKSGRTVWDDEAKSGVSEMAQRNEELRRRIEGKEVHNDEASDAEPIFSSDDDVEDDASDLDEEAAEFQSLQRQLNRVAAPDELDAFGPGSRLSSMKFMKQAEATRKARNDEEIAQMRKELAGEEGSDQSEQEESVGRKIFGPTKKIQTPLSRPEGKNEFEEPDAEEWTGIADDPPVSTAAEIPSTASPRLSTISSSSKQSIATKNNKPQKQGSTGSAERSKKASPQPELLPGEKHTQPDTDGWITVTYNTESDASEKSDDSDAEALLDQAEILRRAFAGDDVEDAFEAEKAIVIADEDEKIIDDTLPGWGSWVGDGLSKREKSRNTGRWFRKEEGIKPSERKDAKLKHVIVNQKRVKKNVSYMASTLPFPFTNRAEYERSIRMPIGSEWNVKETFQDSTKPRVLIKAGSVIKPMEKPMV
jgi:U3 small nucleolar RNA-associated protein 14